MFPRIFSFARKLTGHEWKLFDHIVDHNELLKNGILGSVWRSREEGSVNCLDLPTRLPDVGLFEAGETEQQIDTVSVFFSTQEYEI